MKSEQKDWWQLEIQDPESCSGKNLATLIQIISEQFQIKFVIVDDLIGAIGEELRMNTPLPSVMNLKKLITLIKPATQFEWGDFYLFKNQDNAEKLVNQINNTETPDKDFHRKTIIKSDILTTIRVFDNTSFIIYTKDKNVVEILKQQYEDIEISKKTLKELVFPY